MQTPSRRSIRTHVSKTAKLIDCYSYKNTELQAENKQTTELLATLQSRKRVRVVKDSNKVFADIGNIARAHERAAALQAQWDKRAPIREAQRLSEALIAADMPSFMSEWHILEPDGPQEPSSAAEGGIGGVADLTGGRVDGC